MHAPGRLAPLALAALSVLLVACGGGSEPKAAAEEPAAGETTTPQAKAKAKAAPSLALEKRVRKLEARVSSLEEAHAAMAEPAPEPAAAPAASTPANAATHDDGPHWTYEGEAGPAAWDELDPAFATCGTGRAQSPIDLGGGIGGEATALALRWTSGPATLRNTGHSIQIDLAAGGELVLGDAAYPLVQFHAHTPSEHTWRGERYPLELHFVHRDAKGRLAVVGVLVEEGPAANGALAALVGDLPRADAPARALEAFDPRALLPTALVRTAYQYAGSLTTPPCTEGVRWNVLNGTVTMSAEQIAAFADALPEPENARPVQPLGGREVAVAVAG